MELLLSLLPLIIIVALLIFGIRLFRRRTIRTSVSTLEGESKMDFAKLSKYIIILGIVIFAVGAIVFLGNLPVSSVGGDFGVGGPFSKEIGEAGRFLATHDENMYRSIRRNNAVKAIIAGAIVVFVGIAVKASTKKN